ncbi:MAG: metallophosphoesterase [Planctomycetes bacterium]|nr:metallophosphoesterase [Planctomycetota bacterium]
MASGLRILHLADSHIGAQLPARPRVRGAVSRGDDIVASYRRVLGRAREHEVDLVLHAGDVFDMPDPSPPAVSAAAAPLLELAAAGLPVVIVPGNHERCVIPGSLLFAHPNIHILDRPRTLVLTLRGTRVAIAGVPFIRRRPAERFAAELEQTGWPAAAADVNILLTHQAFEAAVCPPGAYRFRSGEDVVERRDVPAAFHYVAAGHVHRHQVLRRNGAAERKRGRRGASVAPPSSPLLALDAADGPPIVYCGSVDRISFAEQDEAKGCVLIEEAGGRLTHRFLEHDVRPMRRLPMDVSGLSCEQIRRKAAEWARELPRGALAQVRLSGRTTPRAIRGLALAAFVREMRPDLLFDATAQAIEFASERDIAAGEPANGHEDRPRATTSVGPRPMTPASAFAEIDVAAGEIVSCAKDAVAELPTTFATYALYDAKDRLLYIGKATNVRARVRQHLAARPSGAYFEGWTREIARVEARLAHSDLECLLVEADRIRALRPPFNRQMRQWERYCYLCAGQRQHGELTICREPATDEAADGLRFFGPYRSRFEAAAIAEATAALFGLAYCTPLPTYLIRPRRNRRGAPIVALPQAANLCDRYYAKQCCGPCAHRIGEADYSAALDRRAALLEGRDDSAFAAAEAELADRLASSNEELDEVVAERVRFYETLRRAYEHGRLLAAALGLLGSTLEMPGPYGEVTLAHLHDAGVRIERRRADSAAAPRRISSSVGPPSPTGSSIIDSSSDSEVRRYEIDRTRARRSGPPNPNRDGLPGTRPARRSIPKSMLDCLCAATRIDRRDC